MPAHYRAPLLTAYPPSSPSPAPPTTRNPGGAEEGGVAGETPTTTAGEPEPNVTAGDDSEERVKAKTESTNQEAAVPVPDAAASKPFPAVVFSHGLGAMRTTYSTVCCDIASHGYVVAAVEHRYMHGDVV